MSIHTLSLQGAAARAPACFSLAAVAAASLLGASAAAAPSASSPDQPQPEVVVTAARTATAVHEALPDVTVITRAQIEAMAPGRSVAEVLQRLGGVQINSNGGRGQSQSVFIRGAESRHTLLLIDGARHGSATQGAPSLANLPLEMIERIEVVKGPASALYGSEAIGGVIQIFTRRGTAQDQPLKGSASVTLGANSHRAAQASLRGAQNGWDYQLGMSRVLDKGFSAQNAQGYGFEADRDGIGQTSWQAALGYSWQPGWRADASLLRTEGRVRFDSGANYSPFVDMTTQVGRVALQGALSERWQSTLSLSESVDEFANRNGSWNSRAKTTQTELKWEQHIDTAWGTALLGTERLTQKVDEGAPVATPTSRSINAVLAGLTGSHGAHSWQLSARHDDNSQFGGANTYGAHYGLQVLPGMRLHAGAGRSMRAPSFQDLYAQFGGGGWDGNPALTPEKSRSYEFGAQLQRGAHSAKWVRYDNRVSDLIAAGSGGVQHKVNVPGETRLRGWTAEYAWRQQGWEVTTAYDWLKARQADGQVPVGRATSQWRVGVDKALGAWTLGASAIRVGDRRDYSGVTLASYATLDVSARYRFAPDWSVQARVANVTDRDYTIAQGYNTLGRAAYVTLQWAPQ